MDRYIGLDAHASSCTLGVMGPSGKRLGSHVVETNARALIEVLRGIPRNRHVCLEGGTLSGWLYEVLEPHVEELVVAGVRKSRGPKSDKRDAFALAEQLRIGALETRVYKSRGQFRRLGQQDRAGIERLVRYCARPPFALERLHTLASAPALASPESRLLYRFPKPDVNGRTELLLTPLELLGWWTPAKEIQPHTVRLHRPVVHNRDHFGQVLESKREVCIRPAPFASIEDDPKVADLTGGASTQHEVSQILVAPIGHP